MKAGSIESSISKISDKRFYSRLTVCSYSREISCGNLSLYQIAAVSHDRVRTLAEFYLRQTNIACAQK